jgi:hypothetical protein
LDLLARKAHEDQQVKWGTKAHKALRDHLEKKD